MTVRGQEEFETALALAGGMAPVHPVEQVVHIEVHIGRKHHPVNENHLLFVFGVTGKTIGGFYFGVSFKRFQKPSIAVF